MLAFEKDLVERLYARDTSAMALFYERYGKILKHTICRLVRDANAAEDVLQECLVKIWTSFASYNPAKGRLFTWALQITRNAAIDHLRTRHAHEAQRTRPLDHSNSWTPAPTDFQPEHVGVRELLAQLRPADQQLMELLYFQGYTQAEAAQELGLPLGTVKSRARAAIQLLVKTTRANGLPVPAPVRPRRLEPAAVSLTPPPPAQRPANDPERVAALHRYELLHTAGEQVLDELAALVARLFQVPIALLSLVDHDDVEFAANYGLPGGGRINRAYSLCSAAVLQDSSTVFENYTAQPCQLTAPELARECGLQFYAGHPLRSADGYNIGVLCVVDYQPRPFSAAQKALLAAMAAVAMGLVELRLALRRQTGKSFDNWQPLYGQMSGLFGGLSALAEQPAPLLLEAMRCEAEAIVAVLREHADAIVEKELAAAS
ncbi:hypothetical protein GCM10023185_30340 [Hymenobacter saemangeumensis]|uniref:GAF domain-containing protein n=1 Tax=Hymenobacter saemangeumensis TaxID=1084522 RepID=A0ABP8ILI4_9BACT